LLNPFNDEDAEFFSGLIQSSFSIFDVVTVY
jgi:hypothetical protein